MPLSEAPDRQPGGNGRRFLGSNPSGEGKHQQSVLAHVPHPVGVCLRLPHSPISAICDANTHYTLAEIGYWLVD